MEEANPITASRPIEAVLLDMDGVIVDSREAWFQAFQQTTGISREAFDERYWGRDLNANLIELGLRKKAFCHEVFPQHATWVKKMDGVEKTLHQLLEKGLSLAVITNTTASCTRNILSRHGLTDFFHAIVTSDAVEHGKPDPEIIERACAALKVSPLQAVVVGDSPHDIRAGKRAGSWTVGVGVDGDDRINALHELPALLARYQMSAPATRES
jgi:HAD superfamily hydrolase (TIGR01509 family)